MKNLFTRAKAPSAPKTSTSNGDRVLMPFDWWMFTIIVTLLGMGLVMVLSASGIVAEQMNGDKYYFFKRQLAFAGAGALALWVCALMPRDWLYKLNYPALVISFIILVMTLTPLAHAVNGARRWIQVGPLSLQPMEFVKIAVGLYLAYFMSTKRDLIKTFSRGVIPPFLLTGAFGIVLLRQPDFGSFMVLICILFFMCLAGGTRLIYLGASVLMACGGAAALVIAAPYRMRRITAFLDPFKDAGDTGYQLVQSLLAIGSGGFWGSGIGASKQKMFYLPEAHNDFIMAIIGEELGFVGITVVMLLFALFFWRCYKVIMGQSELRDRLSAFALTLIIALGTIINLAVVMGMAPPKGVPMPFLSYGGSNLLASLICVGLLMNFSRTVRPCNGSF